MTMQCPTSNKPSICFVAHNAYGAVSGRDTGHVGGIEHQQATMARWLNRHGYQVSMVTWDVGQGLEADIEGIRILGFCRRDQGLPVVRFLHPRWSGLWRAMTRADAEIYYYNCGDMGLGQMVAWCRRRGRSSVYSVASEPDCDPKLPVLKPLRERFLYRYGLTHADRIVVQTRRQQEMLQEGFGLQSRLIRTPTDGPDETDYEPPESPDPQTARVLWVARISPEKRLGVLLDVAEACPDVFFEVVGAANAENDQTRALLQRAAALPNVTMHGRVAYDRMPEFYRRASLLCCTSAYEGFPNTFLEAWSLGVPVVSTFDPDDLVRHNELGWVAQDVPGLARCIRQALRSPEAWSAASRAARGYYLANHQLDACMRMFEEVFRDVSRDKGRRA
ncbi:MAG: glycosyltransferase family 4 protein [Phycisphaerae bacterium]|nr:glycosyltransferase family 4 protein [Phycisphaerae bacterium]